jgi:hypothetical protein
VDESKWKQEKSDKIGVLFFSNMNNEAWAALVIVPSGVPTTTLSTRLLEVLKKKDPNAKITFEEERIVNGQQVNAFQLSASDEGVPVKGFGYSYSGSAGSVIVIGAAVENQFAKYLEDITELLDGLVIAEPDLSSSANRLALPTPGLLPLTSKISLSYNPKQWKQGPSDKNDDADTYTFSHSSGAGYAVITTLQLPLPLDTLPDIVLAGIRSEDPDAAIVFREKRMVNGTEMWFIKIEGKVRNVPVIFCTYLYSNTAGMVQVTTFTRKTGFGEYEKDFMDFLNGLRISE